MPLRHMGETPMPRGFAVHPMAKTVETSMAVVAALTLLPAVLRLLGRRVDSLRIPYLGYVKILAVDLFSRIAG
jgi:hypothetical protein